MKAFRSTLLLLLLAIALGGYIYFQERGHAVEPGSTLLAHVEPEQVTSLRLNQPHGKTVVLQKSDSGWSVQQGADEAVPADPDTVAQLLDQLRVVQSSELVSSEANKLKDYGLDKPGATLNAGNTTIEFGKRVSFDPSRVYARAGGKVALVPAQLSDAVTLPFEAWRDRAVLRVAAEDIKELEIKAPAITAKFDIVAPTQNSAGGWKVSEPVDAPVDVGVMNSFLYTLLMSRAAPSAKKAVSGLSGGIQTTKFLGGNAPAPAQWGLDKPTATLRVTTDAGPVSLSIGKKVSGGYAAKNSLSPSIFVISEMPFGLINRPLRTWRSKSVLNIEIEDLTALEIAARNSVRRFKKENEKWQLAETSTGAAPDPIAVNAAVVEIIGAAKELMAQDFIDKPGSLAAYGLDEPLLSLAGLELGKKNGKVYGRAAGAGTIYVLRSDVLEQFKRPLDILFPPPKSATPEVNTKGD
jgi:hypothetical protein